MKIDRFAAKKSVGVVTWAVRLAIGALFVFSGFVKAIDPWGTLYKFEDYLGALGFMVWPNLQLAGVFILCGIEFLTGVFLLTGCFRRSIPVVAALLMCGMLPLTLWIALEDPVADCGCFGDAVLLSNWETFWKNVILSAGCVWLLLFNRRCGWLVTPALQWLAFVFSAIYIFAIEGIGYNYQPLMDFRPYKVGSELLSDGSAYDDSPSFIFIYEKDGIRKEFKDTDSIPDENDGWVYIDRREVKDNTPQVAANVDVKNFRIWSEDGSEDVTEDIAGDGVEGKIFILMPDLKGVSIASSWKINSLYRWAQKNGIAMLAVVSGSDKEIEEWKDLSMAEYPIYTADDTSIKVVARGNPAVLFAVNDTIKWKSTLKMLEADDFMAPDTSSDPMSFKRDDGAILFNVTMIYAALMAVLIVMSFLPKMRRVFSFSPGLRHFRRNAQESDGA